jgi:hypothetical protein
MYGSQWCNAHVKYVSPINTLKSKMEMLLLCFIDTPHTGRRTSSSVTCIQLFTGLLASSLCLELNPDIENQVSSYIFPSDRMTQLYPQELGSLFVNFYDSQGYKGDILTPSHPYLSLAVYMC